MRGKLIVQEIISGYFLSLGLKFQPSPLTKEICREREIRNLGREKKKFHDYIQVIKKIRKKNRRAGNFFKHC